MPKRILFVTKDAMPYQMLRPIYEPLKALGAHISIVAEGVSADYWEKGGIELVFRGPADHRKEPFECNFSELFRALHPDCVVVGCSRYVNLELKFAEEANRLGIPVVVVPDLWGVESRVRRSRPSLVLCEDELGEASARRTFGTTVRTASIGYLAALDLLQPLSAKAQEVFGEIRERYEHIAFLACQGTYSQDIIAMLNASLSLSRPIAVVAWNHRNYPEQDALMRAGLDHATTYFDLAEKQISLKECARLADATVSVFSGLLKLSALAGNVAISVRTAATVLGMKESTDLDYFPLCRAGLAIEVAEPQNLSLLIPAWKSRVREQLGMIQTKHFDADRAAREILSVI